MATQYQLTNLRNGEEITGPAKRLIEYIRKAEGNPDYGMNEFSEELSYPHPDFVVVPLDPA